MSPYPNQKDAKMLTINGKVSAKRFDVNVYQIFDETGAFLGTALKLTNGRWIGHAAIYDKSSEGMKIGFSQASPKEVARCFADAARAARIVA